MSDVSNYLYIIDLIDNFDILNIIWMDLYIRDWKATTRYMNVWRIGIWDIIFST
jgi:hypothetical protein